MESLSDFDFLPSIQTSLTEQRLTTPTEIQAAVIPRLRAGKDVVGVAETGSGKTLAYVLPMLDRLKRVEDDAGAVKAAGRPRGVVLVPTRELGEQVTRVFKTFTHHTRLRVRSVLGGTTLEVAKRNVAGPCDVLVATPGRLVQFLQRRRVDLGDVRMLVFDETDQMLDKGFLPDATTIVESCPAERQMAMFSATVSTGVQRLCARLFAGVDIVRTRGSHRLVPTLQTQNLDVEDGVRFPVLERLLRKRVSGGTLIFANTRQQVDRLAQEMAKAGLPCAVYRGEMDKAERRQNLLAFRKGDVRVLIATDLGARGLDVEHVGRVVNYHLPQTLENYLHRAGRTARAGRKGLVVNLVTPRDRPLLRQLETAK
ncbi:MAG: DEAD/DEAH box helicase [Planctomycetota bacterium]